MSVLTLNGGSSSVKFSLWQSGARILGGEIERIGTPEATLQAVDGNGNPISTDLQAANHLEAADFLLDWLKDRVQKVDAVAHRVVHGGLTNPDHQPISEELLAKLRDAVPLDPAHLPREIALIEAFRAKLPNALHIACFDTAFHRNLPNVAKLLPIPRQLLDQGLRRFGFHGLSYTYLIGELARLEPKAANGKVVLAHLGSGASMAALKGGNPIDTSMALTPAAGLVMGTRPGDLDPGLLTYLQRTQNQDPEDLDRWLNAECGLKGVSGLSSDMRDLLASKDPNAKQAVDLFCYQARKFVGAYAAALGGLDTLVFSAGIGERSSEVRAQICAGLEFLGINLDTVANVQNAAVISANESKITVRVIPTDEESVLAKIAAKFMAG